jgi:F420-dependent oxidoreductase-like protein
MDWDGVWMADHFFSSDDRRFGQHECWTSLAAIAALVADVRVGSLVAGNTYRHPAVLANIANTVDHISNGRVVLGVGAGWQQNEHEAYGIELPPRAALLARFEEACAILKSMLANEHTDFAGEYYTLKDAPLEPRSIQRPIPLLIGGSGEKVTMRIAARYADEWNCWGTPETIAHKMAILREHCEREGRDPSSIAVSAQALVVLGEDAPDISYFRAIGLPIIEGSAEKLREDVAAYRDAGVSEFIVPDVSYGDYPRRKAHFERFASEVASAFR